MTQREYALANQVTDEMKVVLAEEHIDEKTLIERLQKGSISIVKNKKRNIKPLAVGEGLSTKINANLGTSPDASTIDFEIEKMNIALKYGADAIMDLSTGGDIIGIRRKILDTCPVALGTVPLYEAGHEAFKAGKKIHELGMQQILDVITRQAKEGVDFMTLHAGLTTSTLKRYDKTERLVGCVSRGGAIMLEWMHINKKENPFYEHYDEILDVLAEYDVTISLGDGMRPGGIADATDRLQIDELITLGELTERAWAKGVQVMIEGPGHVPFDQIETNMVLEKRLCKNAPFYVLGPLVTDIAPGYDHITGAIGATMAATKGADFLCYVTPAEHLRLPTLEDVKEGVIAFKIAAHAADVANGYPHAIDRDNKMSAYRKALDWEGQFNTALDKEKCLEYRQGTPDGEDCCTMCGEFCSMKRDSEVLDKK